MLDPHLAEAGASRRRLKTLGDKRYIRLLFQRPNQLWIGDYHEAPLLWDPDHERYGTLHLCAFTRQLTLRLGEFRQLVSQRCSSERATRRFSGSQR